MQFSKILLIIILLILSVQNVFGLDNSRKEIGADIINDAGITGEGYSICLIDDGVDYHHENLGSCTEAQFLSGDCTTVVDGTNILDNDSDILPKSNQKHGTHIAGILISDHEKYKGIAPDSKLIVVKIYSNSDDDWTCQGLIDAIQWCVDNSEAYNITAISFSLGVNECSISEFFFQNAIDDAISKGISFVKSSGNRNSPTASYDMTFPSELDNVISVGATSSNNQIAGFTRRESTLDLLAPGHKIQSTKTGGGLTSFWNEIVCQSDDPGSLLSISCNSGTSFAAPHVAAAIALLKQYDSGLSPSDIERLLKESGDPIYDPITSSTFKKINLLSAFGIWDWPTDHHDYRRTGFTILKGDIANASDVDRTQVALKEDIGSETIVRPSIADLDGNGKQDVISIVHKTSGSQESDIYRVEKGGFLNRLRTKWGITLKPDSSGTGDGAILLPPSLEDINSDSDKEIIVGMRNGTLFALNPENGDEKWKYELEARLSPFSSQVAVELGGGSAIADIDLDGKNEIVFTDKATTTTEYDWPAKVYVLEDNGNSATLEDSAGFNNGGAFGGVSVANIDSDPEMEIIVPSYYGVSVWDFDSGSLTLKWNNTDGLIDGSVVIYDVDRDNEYELIYATTTFRCSSHKTCANKLYIYNASSGTLEKNISLSVFVRTTPAIANLDSDSAAEIVITGQNTGSSDPATLGKVIAYDSSSGSADWTYDDSGTLQISFSSPDIADIDNDGSYNILFGENNDTKVHVLNNDGTLLFQYDFESFIDSALAIADIDGDGKAEIAIKKAGSPISLLAVTSSTNNQPEIGIIENITAIAGDLIDLNFTGTVLGSDPDNDSITFDFSSPFNSSGLWQSTINDTGNYSIFVEVSDGNLTDFALVDVLVFDNTVSVQRNFTDNSSFLFNFTEPGNRSIDIWLSKDAIIKYSTIKLTGMAP